MHRILFLLALISLSLAAHAQADNTVLGGTLAKNQIYFSNGSNDNSLMRLVRLSQGSRTFEIGCLMNREGFRQCSLISRINQLLTTRFAERNTDSTYLFDNSFVAALSRIRPGESIHFRGQKRNIVDDGWNKKTSYYDTEIQIDTSSSLVDFHGRPAYELFFRRKDGDQRSGTNTKFFIDRDSKSVLGFLNNVGNEFRIENYKVISLLASDIFLFTHHHAHPAVNPLQLVCASEMIESRIPHASTYQPVPENGDFDEHLKGSAYIQLIHAELKKLMPEDDLYNTMDAALRSCAGVN